MNVEELMTMDVDVEPILDLGDSGTGTRRIIPFTGGTFSGRDGLAGTIAPRGSDWQVVRPDGVIDIDAHYVLQTETGAFIEVRSAGIRKASPGVRACVSASSS